MEFQAIIFDLDGTLVDSYPGILHSLNFVLREFGRPPADLAAVKKMVGRGIENLMQQAVGDKDLKKGIALFREDYDRFHLRGSLLMPDVAQTLQILKRHVEMAIASNKPPDYTKSIVKHLRIDRYFVEVSGPGENILPKPNPSMLSHIMTNRHFSPKKTLYVGDMPLDAETARNAAVRVALIPGGGGTVEELRKAAPDYLLKGFSDLPEIVGAA